MSIQKRQSIEKRLSFSSSLIGIRGSVYILRFSSMARGRMLKISEVIK